MNIRRKKRTTPQIPIVALVDILVIVLLFIVATTSFRDKTTQMKISLPQSQGLGSTAAASEKRKTIAILPDRRIMLDGAEVSSEELAAALRVMKESLPNAKLELAADQDTPLGLLVKVWDALKEGGYSINEVPARIQRAARAVAPAPAAAAP